MSKFSFLLNNPYSNAIRNIKAVLDPDQKRRGIGIIVLMIINALSDFIGLFTIGALIISSLEEDIFSQAVYDPQDISEAEYMIHMTLRQLYSWSQASSPIAFLFYLSILIFVIFIIKNALFLYISYLETKYCFSVSLRLNMKMFRYYYDKGYLFIKNSTSGNKVYSIVDIPMKFATNYFLNVLAFTTELIVLAILGLTIVYINPKAVLLLLAAIIPTFYTIYRVSKNRIKFIGDVRNKLAPLTYAKVYEAMNGYVDIKLANFENGILSQYKNIQKEINDIDALYFGIYLRLNSRTNDVIFGMGIAIVFGYAYFSGIENKEVLALLGLFAIAAYKFLPSINRMMQALLVMKNSSFIIQELKVIRSVSLDPFVESPIMPFADNITIQNLSFQYNGQKEYVLKDLNLTIEKGTTIGIIGPSGSGKTTLLKIILRLLNEYEGSLYIDKSTITQENESSYQRLIGYVEQDIFILNDTIMRNIAFGVEHPNEEKVWEALEKSKLADFVKTQPDGINMRLGENGVNLSGGQKQRIGIARALYKDSQILCFDEATSALDNETERAIVESINDLSALDKTIIIVAHRITTLEKCDRIIELVDGRIIGEHNYNNLLKDKIVYSNS